MGETPNLPAASEPVNAGEFVGCFADRRIVCWLWPSPLLTSVGKGFSSMVRVLSSLLYVIIAATCSAMQAQEHNQLTDQEQRDGWKLLFDGKSTDGWRGYKMEKMPPGWQVIEGNLVRVSGGAGGKGAGGGDDIVTVDQYEDFELKLQWKIVDRAGNSGLILRASEDATTSWHTGPEMQILDNAAYPTRDRRQTAGACYDLYAPAEDVARPRGEWNEIRVVARGPHIEHWLNGVKLLEYELGSQDWKQRVAKSKFKDMPHFQNPPMKGHICLQDHTARIEYRNIKLRPLTAADRTGRIERFLPRYGEALEVWQITDSPAVRDHVNYHNTQCWSPEGRYICFTHYAAGNKDEYGNDRTAEIHLFDLAEERDRLIDQGIDPRWANRKPWLFYTKLVSADGPRNGRGAHQMWLDLATGRTSRIGYGLGRPMGTDCGDRWLYGIWYADDDSAHAARIPIREGAEREILPGDWGVGYNSLNVNPAHEVIVSRDHRFENFHFTTPENPDIPFKARHFFDHRLDGQPLSEPFPIMDGAHFAWSGDGTYFLPGNGPLRGRKRNEPLPSNIHLLANISVGDVCPCGLSGRWICGSTGGGTGPLQIADLRSGEGRTILPTHSFLCFPSGQDNSGPYDIDAKGSPDGTKIAFLSTYDLQRGPAAKISGSSDDEIHVDATDGFPESGEIVNPAGFGGEVLRYDRKTPTSFQGLTRGLYGTDAQAPLRTDRMLIALDSQLMPQEHRKPSPLPARWMRDIIKDMSSPLMWQRQTDIYVAVVRMPDPPHLRRQDERIELLPGENHWETRGYQVFRDGTPITTGLLPPGKMLEVRGEGTYSAVAVEWSGLKSEPSAALHLDNGAMMHVLPSTPDDFSWTRERYLVDRQEVARPVAEQSAQAVREIVHLQDGVIHREWLSGGQLTERHDLNPDGKPIRRLFYTDGKLSRREYHDADGRQVSTEHFNQEGFITESVIGRSHWWYERGVPIKFTNGSDTFVPKDDHWIRL